ncbi:MAG: isopentenyl-diphosphate delta-isomerase [Alphaproteobacteria bacterium ADurb.Bin438]|nr:MAG: isopentenyl-diphosphate delta-isomerase [Alphaproteobacteria bacterium ADurb.Bin438]
MTGKSMEYFDIYDLNMRPIEPYKISKSEAHKKGYWHKTFHCWIVNKNNKVLLQLRPSKDGLKELFDISTAGHIMSGESPEDGVRELKEELNLDVNFSDLTFAGIYKHTSIREEDNYFNNEFSYTYFYKSEKNLDEYVLQEEEVRGVFEIDIDEGIKFFAKEIDTLKVSGLVLNSGSLVKKDMEIKLKQMCMYHERCVVTNYYLRALIMVKRFIQGKKHIAI